MARTGVIESVGPKAEAVLRVGTLTTISTLDPHRAHDFTGHIVISQVFESPYQRIDGRFVPRLVVGQPSQRDAGTFELEVRPDARFSDGTRLTAGELAAAIVPTVAAYGVEVSASGDKVILYSRHGWHHRPEDLLSRAGAKVVKREGNRQLGTGPFAIQEASKNGVRLVRNPHAARAPKIDAIEIRWYPPSADGRPDALLAAIDAGDIDFSPSLARDDVTNLQGVRKLFQPGMSTAFLAINTMTPHFSRAMTRRAIAWALDRYKLASLCYTNPAAFVARCLLPPALGRGQDGLRHDPAAARAALSGATHKMPARLHMIRVWGPRPYLARPDAVGAGITQQLAAIDIQVDTTVAKDSEDYGALLARGQYDLVLGGWFADTPDPIDYLDATLGSGGILGAGQVPVAASNYARWKDPEVDRLLVDARGAGGTRAIDDILARVASEVPLVPLMHGPRVIVHSWRVKGYDPDAGVFPDFATIDLDG
jgi:ABC-type transport system substrate-binding protein